MKIRLVDPEDHETLDAAIDTVHATYAADVPWYFPWTKADYRVVAREGMDGEPPAIFVGEIDGAVVAHCDAWLPERDNRHLAWMKLLVHPDHRRRGLGTQLLEHVLAEAKERGRTSAGMDGWDISPVPAFAARHGFEQKAVEVARRQHLRELDRAAVDRVFAEAQRAAVAYELVRIPVRTPEELIDDVVTMVAAINDAPIEGLDVEDEVFTRERVWAYEDVQAARNHRLYRLVARHRDTGELAGHTVVVVKGEIPTRGGQHDTSVVRAHRGHRLGALLKSGMVRWLAETEPQLETIDTTNAESNSYMIGINEQLGYRVMGRTLEFQRDL